MEIKKFFQRASNRLHFTSTAAQSNWTHLKSSSGRRPMQGVQDIYEWDEVEGLFHI